MLDPRLPVIVGAGQALQRAAGLDDALHPAQLMAVAVRAAAADAGLASVPDVESIRVVSQLSWRSYRDPARFVADELGITTSETALTSNGGNSPQMLVNVTAGEIQQGRLDLAVLTGGETWRTRMRAHRSGAQLTWPKLPDDVRPGRIIGTEVSMNDERETAIGLVMPVQYYPMFETALRAAAGETVEDHQVRISELWARFSAVAAGNPYAWVREAKTAEEIRTPGPENRMIGFPYPKLMNSNNDVDQAAALIMCSVERARALGIPEDRWVFVHAGTDTHETYVVGERASFADAPAVRIGGRRALDLAGLGLDDVAFVDLYSCFPSAVQLGAAALGLALDDPDRPLTVTGGLSFAGGPWNNYPMHAIATMVGRLRERPDTAGLVWANGGFVTKHAFGVYAARPPATGAFRHDEPQAEIDALPRTTVADGEDAAGPVTIEAYTVMHDRDGRPETAFAAVRLPDGRRAWATSKDPSLTAALCEGEWVGRPARVDAAAALTV